MFKEMDVLNKAIIILSTVALLLGVIPPWNIIAVALMWGSCYVVYKHKRT